MSVGLNTDDAGDINSARLAWLLGGFGIAALVAYGSYALQRGGGQAPDPASAGAASPMRTPEHAAVVPPRARQPAADSSGLLADVGHARATLDVMQLARLDAKLHAHEQATSDVHLRSTLRLARAEALAVRALEASLRATSAGGGDAAQAQALMTRNRARELLATVGDAPQHRARIRAARARIDLSQGVDVTEQHPVLLLPDFHDAELRMTALARPLWIDANLEDGELDELIAELRSVPSTGTIQALLAVAMMQRGDDQGALATINALLHQVPSQPLATALKRRLTAVAAVEPALMPSVAVGNPAPKAEAFPPRAVPPPPQRTATPSEPSAPSKPSADSAPGAKPKKTRPPKKTRGATKRSATKRRGFDELLEAGCKQVRDGDAKQGFKTLKRAHDLKPGGTKVTLCMARAQAALGQLSSARALVDRILRRSPRNKSALVFAAKTEATQGNSGKALKLYRRVLAIDPDHSRAKAFVAKHG